MLCKVEKRISNQSFISKLPLKIRGCYSFRETNYRIAFPAPVLPLSPCCLAISFLSQFMPLHQNLLKKNILLSLQILWEIAVTVGGKQMENAFVYIKLWHVQEASSTPHPELRVWAQASGGRKGVICILWGDWVGAKGQTDYHWQLCIWEPAQWEVESKQWKWPGKQMEPKSLGGV